MPFFSSSTSSLSRLTSTTGSAIERTKTEYGYTDPTDMCHGCSHHEIPTTFRSCTVETCERYSMAQKPLKRIIRCTKLPNADFGVSMCTIGGRVYVTDVLEETAAWRAGLQVGDHITEINGQPANSRFSAPQVMLLLRSLTKVVLEVIDAPLVQTHILTRSSPKDLLGLVYYRSAIQSVLPRSAAAKSAVRIGDSIFRVGGASMLGRSDSEIMGLAARMFAENGEVEIVCAPAGLAKEFGYAYKCRRGSRPRQDPRDVTAGAN
eukprot:comp22165_c0_seq1/m.32509 comp22165_c0_seq1/g.32509  ORF comp22165_c0_seq1/g.32509 comp22165_c0_seq1/m.32509 type:complete len:263 (-) comp22165_c0_seq1:178-966(-)